MKKYIFILLLFCSVYAIGQNKITFKYDEVGNRTEKVIQIATKTLSVEENPEIFTKKISKRDIKIYSSIQGQITVEFSTLEGMKNGTMHVYSFPNGTLVLNSKVKNLREDLDISSQPTGIYILLIDIDGEKTSYKLLK